jgi:hypothetical protein
VLKYVALFLAVALMLSACGGSEQNELASEPVVGQPAGQDVDEDLESPEAVEAPSAAELVGELGPEVVQRREDTVEKVLGYVHPEGIDSGLVEASYGSLASGNYTVFVYEDAASAKSAYEAWKSGEIGTGISKVPWTVTSETEPEDGAYTVVLSSRYGTRSVTVKGPYVLSVSGVSAATREGIEADFLRSVP